MIDLINDQPLARWLAELIINKPKEEKHHDQ